MEEGEYYAIETFGSTGRGRVIEQVRTDCALPVITAYPRLCFSTPGRMLSLLPFNQHAGEVQSSSRDGTQPVEDHSEELWDAAVLSKVP